MLLFKTTAYCFFNHLCKKPSPQGRQEWCFKWNASRCITFAL